MDDKGIKYPIYIISKGRYYNPLTVKCFMKEHIDFKIAIEPQEFDLYSKMIPKKNILVLPFSNLGLGSTPARNFCWEHSIKNGFEKHHIFDDNIYGFNRLNHDKRIRTTALESIIILEKLTDLYSNVGISGFNYNCFGIHITRPFRYNTHVYSALLIDNSIPYRWRMKYNEDIDLCLQILDSGLCTIQLCAFLILKISTSAKMRGGNQDELYKGNDPNKKLLKAKSIETIWPQYVKTIVRYGRPHHQISWKKYFKQPLKRVEE